MNVLERIKVILKEDYKRLLEREQQKYKWDNKDILYGEKHRLFIVLQTIKFVEEEERRNKSESK